ncbi:MAG: DUF2809 domain-containing protein [Oscillospiraceae bacterium]|nr:DUF2809 domain-containing protein [Oscillospiraceae bacterium]
MKKKSKIRLAYVVATLLLMITEVLIALYVRDNFIRPYVGDVLAVILIYTFIRIFIPEKCRILPILIFIFAACIEILQYFDLVSILGVENNTFLRILLGSVFDLKDIVCYAVGCIVLGIYEIIRVNKR